MSEVIQPYTAHTHNGQWHDHPDGNIKHDHILRQPGMAMQVMPKSPATAVILSFFIPGLGSMTSGKGGVGAMIIGIWLFGWILGVIALIGFPIALGAWIWGMCHAYGAAKKWNYEHGILS